MQKAVQIHTIQIYEIQQRERLLQAVLQRVPVIKSPQEMKGCTICERIESFETEFLEGWFLDEADLVARYAHFEILWDESVRDDVFTLFFGSGEDNDVHI